MEKNIKQVSSLETIFSYENAHTIDTVTVLGGERFSYQIVINPPKSYRFEISVDTPDLNNAVTLYKVREAVVDLPTPPLPLTIPITLPILLSSFGFSIKLSGFFPPQLLLQVEQSCVHSLIIINLLL